MPDRAPGRAGQGALFVVPNARQVARRQKAPTAPERVKVGGDLFHPRVPDGAIYVGRQCPGLFASEFANPFKVGEPILRDSDLWHYAARSALTLRGVSLLGMASVTLTLAEDATDAYGWWFIEQPRLMLTVEKELGDRDLACWCKLPRPGQPDHCHGRWLIDFIQELRSTR